ncbi:hypothetical protein K501DRAFT_332217 [Backusella circina FSU 941]|nr:hypothetical protein K501DRAFT_332217 [Backusella circina FSU 941]
MVLVESNLSLPSILQTNCIMTLIALYKLFSHTPFIFFTRHKRKHIDQRKEEFSLYHLERIPADNNQPTSDNRSLRNRKRSLQYAEISSDEDDYFIDSTSKSLPATVNKRHKSSSVKSPQQINNGPTTEPSYIGYIDKALLFTKDSPLGQVDLKSMIPIWLSQLSPEDHSHLLTLLPDADKSDDSTLSPDFLSSSNHIFWDAVSQWENTLICGGFSQSSSAEDAEPDDFKDENYERYWGERLEKNREARRKAAATAKGGRRGRGRGLGRGRGRGGKVREKD